MPTWLLILLCLTGHGFAKEKPDVSCSILHLEYVHCSWNQKGTPEVNYTFYGGFSKSVTECTAYVLENVKLNPPINLTVQMGSDNNLWFFWNQTSTKCVESEVQYRTNNKIWEVSKINLGTQSYCINLPSTTSRYELQVRSKIGNSCGDSIFWSDWSEPVVWASTNSTDISTMNSMSVWTPVLYVLGALTLLLLVMMLLHHERLRIILIPVVPKPSLNSHDIQEWLQLSKGLKERANYNERACPVREYCHVSQSDSESSDSSTCSVTTDQTDCSVSIPVDKSDLSTPCSSSTSTVSTVEPEQISV
ncbi:Cytokine receptor common subunit gamma [Collichthys lucidus]|uniref:Cytokine receptor common subunit gamma n=1 Tax=Collichthys lucidus TaxID=240159 RepID=A0A4V6XYV1_COLLU|nr:Cytokine receptor common subunit gamma [Collichthys lucidus]